MNTKKVGFIGLGIMGKPMARNLMKAGFDLTVFNRTRSKMNDLVREGTAAADSPKEVADRTDITITMVTDTPDVESVILGSEGVSEGARPGHVVIDMSTISPRATRDMAGRLAQRGIEMLDAPVSGGDIGAIQGTLSIMVGGKKKVFEQCLPVLRAMGKTVTLVGGHGAGQTMKLCNQVMAAVNLASMCEGLAFAAKSGLDLQSVIDVVGAGAASSWALLNIGPKIVKGDMSPGFMVKLMQKDLGLVLDAARENVLPLPVTALVNQLLRSVEAAGGGEMGTQALIRALEKMGNFGV